MTSRERVKTIFSGQTADRCAFWLGMPHPDTLPIYLDHFGFDTDEQLRQYLHDDIRWICPEWTCYKHPQAKSIFDLVRVGIPSGAGPVLADAEEIAQIDDYDWPDVRYLDFSETLAKLRSAGDVYRLSGMWTCFFHIVADLIGMENYFVKMYTHPELIEALTERICDFYYKANEIFFAQAGDDVDAYFLGNDFGTQLDLLVGPDQIDRFIMPYTRMFVEQGHRWGHRVMHHCCGAVYKMIPRFIEAGIEALHPLQARACNMDAQTLARDFRGRIAFVGGIDTQELLVHGTPEEVAAEVRRVRDLLGPCLVISPSHEALLPNVPIENVIAMAEAAWEDPQPPRHKGDSVAG